MGIVHVIGAAGSRKTPFAGLLSLALGGAKVVETSDVLRAWYAEYLHKQLPNVWKDQLATVASIEANKGTWRHDLVCYGDELVRVAPGCLIEAAVRAGGAIVVGARRPEEMDAAFGDLDWVVEMPGGGKPGDSYRLRDWVEARVGNRRVVQLRADVDLETAAVEIGRRILAA